MIGGGGGGGVDIRAINNEVLSRNITRGLHHIHVRTLTDIDMHPYRPWAYMDL